MVGLEWQVYGLVAGIAAGMLWAVWSASRRRREGTAPPRAKSRRRR